MAGHFDNPDFTVRQLQYAVAIAETGGFSTAAEACGVSQPSLSAQVAKLEGVLDVQLFERGARSVRVTAAGAALLARMRHVLDEVSRLDAAARTLRDPYATPLKVGVIPTVAPYLLPTLVEQLRVRRPRPIVHWLELQTAVCEARLAEGQLDAMIIADPPTDTGVDAVEIGWEPFVVVVPAESDIDGPVGVADLEGLDLLLLEEGHCLRSHTLEVCTMPGATDSPFRATSLPTLVQMVASGLGISVLPVTAREMELTRASVRAVPFDPPTAGRTLQMGWRRQSPHHDVLEELAGVASTALAAIIG